MTLGERKQQLERELEQVKEIYLRKLGAVQLINELESEGYELCKPEQPEQSEQHFMADAPLGGEAWAQSDTSEQEGEE